MSDIAYYQVLKDAKTTLTPGGEPWIRKWTAPDDINLEERAVLTFMADPNREADLTLEIKVNGSVVRSPSFIGGVQRGMLEVLGDSDLEKGKNEFCFAVTEGTGTLAISDVVLWYKRTIA